MTLSDRSPGAAERGAAVDALERVGPGAPTLCAGWRSEHLAAHLVLREHAPAVAVGIVLPPLAERTERAIQQLGDRSVEPQAWSRLLERIRTGPPAWNPLRWVGGTSQTVEYFVHTEDVRRAGPDGAAVPPREGPPERDGELWSGLVRMAALALRRAPVPVVLTDGAGRDKRVGRSGPEGRSAVVVRGPVGELLLHVMGRGAVARVDVEGDAASVAALDGVLPR